MVMAMDQTVMEGNMEEIITPTKNIMEVVVNRLKFLAAVSQDVIKNLGVIKSPDAKKIHVNVKKSVRLCEIFSNS